MEFKTLLLKLYNRVLLPESSARTKLYNAFLWRLFPDPLDKHLLNLVSNRGKLKFIVIGANDGVTYDPLFKFITRFKWEGLMVEPHPVSFESLKKNYNSRGLKNIYFENVAISETSNEQEFFYFDVMGLTKKERKVYSCLSSLDRSHLEKYLDGNPDLVIKSIMVESLTLVQLIEKYEMQDIDLLMIDAEGSDFEILNSIDFTLINPTIIYYEHFHFSEEQKQVITKMLADQQYQLMEGVINSIAYK